MAFAEKYANFDLATGDNDGSSEANAWQTPAAVISNVAAGDRVNIKRQSSGYNLTSSVDFNVAGTATSPIWYRAYTSTIGDSGMWLVNYNAAGIAWLSFTGNYCIVEGIDFQPGATTNDNAFVVQGVNSWAIRCRANNRSSASYPNMMFCDIKTVGTGRITTNGTNSHNAIWAYSRLWQSSASSSYAYFLLSDNYGRTHVLINNLIIGNGIAGVDGIFLDRQADSRSSLFSGNVFYNFRNGIYVDENPNATREEIVAINNIFDNMGSYAIYTGTSDAGFMHLLGNSYYDCTDGFTNYPAESIKMLSLALTASPFTSPSTQDFSLNATSGGGASLRSRGYPINELFDWTNMTFKATYSGGGGGLLLHPGMNGGLNG